MHPLRPRFMTLQNSPHIINQNLKKNPTYFQQIFNSHYFILDNLMSWKDKMVPKIKMKFKKISRYNYKLVEQHKGN